MAGKKVIEIIVLDSSSSSSSDDDDEELSTPILRVKNKDEMKKLENANEDCFILEFDPDDDADLDLSKLSISDENADSELLIVAQKGQVACRDFPHSRHTCARFPFKTTPRDIYCEFCYCYVCDLPAPCTMWGGSSNHCYAFDDERWNRIRKLKRDAKKLQEQGGGDVKKGTVKWFDDLKGFGFITPDEGTGDLFVHRSSIKSDGIRSLRDGEAVEYKVEVGNDGRLKATDVTGPNGESVQGSTRGSGGGRDRGGSGYHGPLKSADDTGLNGESVEGPTRGSGGGRDRGGGGYHGRGGGWCYICGQEGHFTRECPNPNS